MVRGPEHHSEDNGDAILTGPVVDQAALHGLLRKVRDLGMPLISAIRVKPPRQMPQTSNSKPRLRSAT